MNDAREVIAEAIPCNIVYGRPQAADDIMRALAASGYRILGPDELDAVTVEKCAEVAASHFNFHRVDKARVAGGEIAAAIRALCATHHGDQ